MQIPPLRRASASYTDNPPHSLGAGRKRRIPATSETAVAGREGRRANRAGRTARRQPGTGCTGAGGTALPDRAPRPALASKLGPTEAQHSTRPPNAQRFQGSGTPSRPPRAHQRDACGAKLPTAGRRSHPLGCTRGGADPPRALTSISLPLWKAGRLSGPPGLASVLCGAPVRCRNRSSRG